MSIMYDNKLNLDLSARTTSFCVWFRSQTIVVFCFMVQRCYTCFDISLNHWQLEPFAVNLVNLRREIKVWQSL